MKSYLRAITICWLALALWVAFPATAWTADEISYSFGFVTEKDNFEGPEHLGVAFSGGFPEWGLCQQNWAGITNCSESLLALYTQHQQLGNFIALSLAERWKSEIISGAAIGSYLFATTGPPTNDPDVFKRPIVTDDFVYLVGYTALAIPTTLAKTDQIRVSLNFQPLLVSGYQVGCSWPLTNGTATKTVTAEELGQVTILITKNLQKRNVAIGRQTLTTVHTDAKLKPAATQLTDFATILLTSYTNYYGVGPDAPQTLIVLPVKPSADKHPKINGISLKNAITLFVPPESDLRDDQTRRWLAHFLAHELGHLWLGQRIRAGANEGELAWFIEGFTNHIARKMLFYSGIYSRDDYLWDLNHTISLYRQSPIKAASNDMLAQNWGKQGGWWQLMPYIRGDLIAFWLDNRYRAENSRLRNIMRFFLDYQQPLTAKLVLMAFAASPLQPADKALLRAAVEDGADIPLDAAAFAPCFKPNPTANAETAFAPTNPGDATCRDLL